MRIAILYICTGRYTVFWNGFFSSCEKYFLKNHECHYFVFTDGEIQYSEHPRVHRVEQARLGWPHDTLKRFHMFSKVRKDLEKFDYIFFLNANVLFCGHVDDSVLPTEDEGLVVVQHPAFYHRPRSSFSYEKNPYSLACIADDAGSHYVCGGVNGGTAKAYLQMVDTLRAAIDEDESKDIVAIWHDESHINKYILSHSHKLLNPGYCSPEESHLPFEEKIIILNKEKFGGHSYLRSLPSTVSYSRSIKVLLKWFFKSVYYRVLALCKFARDAIRYELTIADASYAKIFGKLHFDVDINVNVPGFQHCVDKRWFHGERLCALLMQKRMPAGRIKAIYGCYVLNYLEREDIYKVLARWYDLLADGGVLRVSFPDPDKVRTMHAIAQSGDEVGSVEEWFARICGDAAEESRLWKCFFSADELESVLYSVGFKGVARYPHVPHFGSSEYFSEKMYEVVDRSLVRDFDRNFVSVNMLAVK